MDKLPNKELYGATVSAIVFCDTKQVNGKQALKYRHVTNTFNGIDSFIKFANRFPGVHHINFYNRKDKTFIEQHKY